MADEPLPDQVRLRDPLTQVTRRERTLLLGLSVVAVGVVKIGLLPTKISALGIEFDAVDHRALVGLIATVIGYFLAAFVIYAISDYLAWARAYEISFQKMLKGGGWSETHTAGERLLITKWFGYMIVPTIRALFEFLVPVILGVYAIILALTVQIPSRAVSAPVAPSKQPASVTQESQQPPTAAPVLSPPSQQK